MGDPLRGLRDKSPVGRKGQQLLRHSTRDVGSRDSTCLMKNVTKMSLRVITIRTTNECKSCLVIFVLMGCPPLFDCVYPPPPSTRDLNSDGRPKIENVPQHVLGFFMVLL